MASRRKAIAVPISVWVSTAVPWILRCPGAVGRRRLIRALKRIMSTRCSDLDPGHPAQRVEVMNGRVPEQAARQRDVGIRRRLVVAYSVVGVKVHDARLVAAMLVHGVTHLLTLNTNDFTRYSSITAVHPRTVTETMKPSASDS